MSERLLFGLGAIFFVGVFRLGLRSGEMPTRAFTFSRARYPTMFKLAGAFRLLLAFGCAWVAVTMP